jgi:hypothetical protein
MLPAPLIKNERDRLTRPTSALLGALIAAVALVDAHRLEAGFRHGALCAIDQRLRTLTEHELEILRDLGARYDLAHGAKVGEAARLASIATA